MPTKRRARCALLSIRFAFTIEAMRHLFSQLAPLAICCAALSAVCSPVSAADKREAPNEARRISSANINPAAISLSEQIVALGYPKGDRETLFFATMDQTVEQMRREIIPSLPSDDPVAVSILDEWIADYTTRSKEVLRKHIPDIMAGMVEAYATIFTVEELTDILAFVQTPSGQRYFELSPGISAGEAFSKANQRYWRESMDLLAPAQKDLSDRLDEYMATKQARNAPPET